jgi:hypothetical protein
MSLIVSPYFLVLVPAATPDASDAAKAVANGTLIELPRYWLGTTVE